MLHRSVLRDLSEIRLSSSEWPESWGSLKGGVYNNLSLDTGSGDVRLVRMKQYGVDDGLVPCG